MKMEKSLTIKLYFSVEFFTGTFKFVEVEILEGYKEYIDLHLYTKRKFLTVSIKKHIGYFFQISKITR